MDNHYRDYFFMSLIAFLVSIWVEVTSNNFDIRHEPLFISKNIIHIQQEKTILIKYNRYGGFLLFDMDGKIVQAECYKISDEYRRICDRKLSGGTIKASNIEFLDVRSPKLVGIFLSGKFMIGSEELNLDIHHNKEAIDNYIFHKKIEIGLSYTFTLGSFLLSIFFFFKLKPN